MQFLDSKSVKQHHVSMADFDLQIHVFYNMKIGVYARTHYLTRDATLHIYICCKCGYNRTIITWHTNHILHTTRTKVRVCVCVCVCVCGGVGGVGGGGGGGGG